VEQLLQRRDPALQKVGQKIYFEKAYFLADRNGQFPVAN